MNKVQMRNATLMWMEFAYACQDSNDPDVRDRPTLADDEHDPDLEPYASMTRNQIAEAMDLACKRLDAREFFVLHGHFLDRCSAGEITYQNLAREVLDKIAMELIGDAFMHPRERHLGLTRRAFDMLDDIAEEFGGEGSRLAEMDVDKGIGPDRRSV